jgi:hypothetical protein
VTGIELPAPRSHTAASVSPMRGRAADRAGGVVGLLTVGPGDACGDSAC